MSIQTLSRRFEAARRLRVTNICRLRDGALLFGVLKGNFGGLFYENDDGGGLGVTRGTARTGSTAAYLLSPRWFG